MRIFLQLHGERANTLFGSLTIEYTFIRFNPCAEEKPQAVSAGAQRSPTSERYNLYSKRRGVASVKHRAVRHGDGTCEYANQLRCAISHH